MALTAKATRTDRAIEVAAVSWRARWQLVALLVDLVMIALAIGCAVVVRFGSRDDQLVGVDSLSYTTVSLVLGLAWLIALQINQCYRTELFGLGTEEYRGITRATFNVFGAAAIVSLLFRLDIARGYLAIAFPLGLVLLLLGRFALRIVLVSMRKRGAFSERVLIVGAAPEVRHAAEAIRREPAAGYATVAVAVADRGRAGAGHETEPAELAAADRGEDLPDFALADGTRVPNRGSIVEDVPNAVRDIDVLIVAGHAAITPRQLRSIGWQLEGTTTRLSLASSMTDVAGPRIHRRAVEGLPLMSVESPTYRGTKFVVKRGLDIVLSAVALIVLSPLLVALSLGIWLDDRGPVLFRQTRVGVGGRLFKMTKFRSMVTDAELLRSGLQSDDPDGVLFKMRDDPRVTRIGRFLRAYSLDELPQLLDVLIGHMSLVGPRPPLPDEVSRYEAYVHRRLNVKPGVTGLWQVGGRSNLTWSESVQKDLYYVENWSVIGDLSIMVRTIGAVLRRDGAR